MLARNRKRILSMILAVIMVLGMLPLSAAAVENTSAQQIVTQGTTRYYDDSGNEITGNNVSLRTDGVAVAVSKTIEGTDTENIFDITLGVTTTEKKDYMQSATGADVVLVFDVSTSMDSTTGGKSPSSNKWRLADTRWTALKASASNFIDELLTEGSSNRVSIVVYGGGNQYNSADVHKTLCDWTSSAAEAKGTFQNYDVVCQDYVKKPGVTNKTSLRKAVFGDNGTKYGATNCQAGFWGAGEQLGKDAVKDSANAPYVVYMSDGATNRRYRDYDGNTVTSGWHYGTSAGEDNSSIAVAAAKVQTKKLKDDYKDLTIYTIGFGLGEDGNNVMSPSGKNGNKAVDRYVPAEDAEELEIAFGTVTELIHLKANAWIVTDPMTSVMEFQSFESSVGPSILKFDEKTDTIIWTVKKDAPNPVSGKRVGNVTYYTYQQTYRVKLDNTVGGVSATSNPTNGRTYLTYVISEADGSVADNAKLLEADFSIPAVKPLYASLELTKVASNAAQDKINNAVFKLESSDGNYYASGEKATDADGKVTFTGLPSGGHIYTLTETSVPDPYDKDSATGYTVEVDWGVATLKKNGEATANNTIVNKYLPGERTIEAKKVWRDGDVIHPSAYLTLTQKLNGTETGEMFYEAIGGDEKDEETVSFKVPQRDRASGVDYTYVLGEANTDKSVNITADGAVISGYTTKVNQESTTVTNTRSNDDFSITVDKTWINASDNQYNQDITITLTGTGSEGTEKVVRTATLKAGESSVTFDKLPQFDANGIAYRYVATDKVDNYVESSAGVSTDGKIHLTNMLETTGSMTVSGVKTWNDGNNEDMDRPESIQVQIYNNDNEAVGEPITVTPNADGKWEFSKKDLEKYKVTEVDGKITEIEARSYYVRELDESGTPVADNGTVNYSGTSYKVLYTENSYNISNTRANNETGFDFSITKKWDDNGDAQDKRPETITVKLYADGTELTEKAQEIAVTSENEQSVEWTGLPEFDANGKRIQYTAADSVTHYEASYNAELKTLTNKLVEADITGSKLWIDANNAEELRPASIDVELVDDLGEVVKTITVKAPEESPNSNVWPFSFTDVPMYRTVVINTEPTSTEPTSTEPTSTEPTSTEPTSTEPTSTEPTSTEPTNVGPVTEQVPISYTVREKTVPNNYTATREEAAAEDDYQLINTLADQSVTIQATVNKTWVDANNAFSTRPTVTFELQKKVTVDGSESWQTVETKQLSNGTVSFTAPKYTNAELNVYQVIEQMSNDAPYTSSMSAPTVDENGNITYTCTNILQQQTTSINGTKSWVTLPGVTTPNTIKVQVFKGSEPFGQPLDVTLGEGGTFTISEVTMADGSTAKLEKYVISGEGTGTNYTLQTYSVKECLEDGTVLAGTTDSNSITYDGVTYRVSYEGNVITNTQKLDTTSIKVTKHWGDPAGTEHPVATFTLYQWLNGSKTGYTETWSTTDGSTDKTESHDFNNLAVYADHTGNRYTYTVEETGVPDGYHKVETEGDYNFLNVIDKADVTISGTKYWTPAVEGGSVPEKAYPAEIVVELYRAGTDDPIDTVTVTPDEETGAWTYIFTVKDGMYDDNGNYIQYTVKEKGVNSTDNRIVYGTGDDAYTFGVTYGEVTRNEDGNLTANITNQCLNVYQLQVVTYYRTVTDGVPGPWSDGVVQRNSRGFKDEEYTLARLVGDEKVDETLEGYKTYDGNSDYTLLPDEGTHKVTLTDPGEIYMITYYFERSVITNTTITVTHNYYTNGSLTATVGPETKNATIGSAVTASSFAAPTYGGNTYSLDTTHAATQNIASVKGGEAIVLNYNRTTGGGGGYTPPDPVNPRPVTPPERDEIIDDDPTPLAPAPDAPAIEEEIIEEDVPLGDLPEDEVIIEEEDVPLGDLPQTGAVAAPVNPTTTLGLIALSMSLVAVGLAYTYTRKKDEEEA